MYLFGVSVKQDYNKAFYYAELRAKKGSNPANDWLLSNLYFEGKGTKKDFKKAFYLALDTAKQNPDFKEAVERVIQCYKEGLGVEKDLEKAKEWEKVLKESKDKED